jgi:transcriptional regulator with XRE-family HTH domain
MKSTKTDAKVTVQEALRQLRQTMNLSQEGLARKLDVSFRTIHRFENEQPPKGVWLLMFGKLADQHGRNDLATVFLNAFPEQLGLKGIFKGTISQEKLPNGERVGFMIVSLESAEEIHLALATLRLLTRLKDAAPRKLAADFEKKVKVLLNRKAPPSLLPAEIPDNGAYVI